MNEYSYDEISVGDSCRFEKEVTAFMMEQFMLLTGDNNPLHCDEKYAVSLGYRGKVVYGMLTSSLYSTLAGVYLPGKYCLIHSVETKLLKPVYIGDVLLVEGRVTEKNDVFRQLVIKTVINNQNGEKVSKGIIKAGVQHG